MATLAPRCANAWAMPQPMPPLPPVTMTVRPETSMTFLRSPTGRSWASRSRPGSRLRQFLPVRPPGPVLKWKIGLSTL